MGIHSKHVDTKTRRSIQVTEKVIDLVGREIMGLIGYEIDEGADIRAITAEAAVRLEILRARIGNMQSIDELYKLVDCDGQIIIDDIDQEFLENISVNVLVYIIRANIDVLSQNDVRELVRFCLMRYSGPPVNLGEINIALEIQISGVTLAKFLKNEEDLLESKLRNMKRWLIDFLDKRGEEELEDE